MIKFKRLLKSFTYAFKGLVKTFREEQNLKIQSSLAFIAVVFGVYFKIGKMEWVALMIVIFMVLMMELLNSAVERVADVLKPRINSYVKEIKDIMAAVVLVSAMAAIVVGLIIFVPYLIR